MISPGETGRGVVSSAADPDFGNGLRLIGLIYLRHVRVYLGALYTSIPEIYSVDIADDISRRRVGNMRYLARHMARPKTLTVARDAGAIVYSRISAQANAWVHAGACSNRWD